MNNRALADEDMEIARPSYTMYFNQTDKVAGGQGDIQGCLCGEFVLIGNMEVTCYSVCA